MSSSQIPTRSAILQRQTETCLDTDVAIIGGGPAGSTLATLLARKGYRVSIIEKDKHPRFHVGESLLPMNLPIFERMGILEQINKIGVPKLGADFTFGDDPDVYHTFRFEQAMGNSAPYAFEVKRDELDHLLFETCRDAGAEVFENTRVTAVKLDKQISLVQALSNTGESLLWKCKMVVDASGRDAFMASKNGWRKKNRRHASAAIFGHFKGVERRPGRDTGNISIYWFAHGWIWMIPLRDDIVSIGAACLPEYLKTRRTETTEFLWDTLAMSPSAMVRLANAEPASPVRVAANYSYSSSTIWNDSFLAIGDACAFVDPVFSSGVYLAMENAEQVAPAIEYKLQGNQRKYRATCRRYAKTSHRGLSIFSWFIYRFTTPAMRLLFANPRNILNVQKAVISMLAGDVFENKSVLRRLWVFKLFYSVGWLLTLRQSLAHKRRIARSLRQNLQDVDEV